MFPKSLQHRSEAWRRAVASLPCACCFREGTQAAHLNHRGKGMGMKAPDCYTIPLCPACHAEFDQGRKWPKHEKRAMADEWLIQTILQLASKGLVKA